MTLLEIFLRCAGVGAGFGVAIWVLAAMTRPMTSDEAMREFETERGWRRK